MEGCRVIHHRWTLRGLVASYLDLALAYLFLCAASFAFFVSKALSLVGISVPCSCGLDLIDRRHHQQRHQQQRSVGCLQRFLLDCTAGKIGGVFDSFCLGDCRDYRVGRRDDVRFINHTDEDSEGSAASAARGKLDLDRGEESCCSVSQPHCPRDSTNLSLMNNLLVDRGESSNYRDKDFVDVKGKAIVRQERPPNVLKRRKRQKNNISIKTTSLSALPSSLLEVGRKGEVATATPLTVNAPVFVVESSSNVIPGTSFLLSGYQKAIVEEINYTNPLQTMEKTLSNGIGRVRDEEKNECDVTRELKQALEEEKSTRAALCLELEKERNAAASAADEAMAMIFRLQEEKSAVQMEARQYQRMAEEKSAYDEEEKEILKEIIVRREREKHVLQKEVEAYQQMIVGVDSAKQISGSNLSTEVELIEDNTGTSFGSFDDTELILKTVYESIKKNERCRDEVQHVDAIEPLVASVQKSSTEFVNESAMSQELHLLISADDQHNTEEQCSNLLNDRNDCHVQEKGMLTMERVPSFIESNGAVYANGSSSPRLIGTRHKEDNAVDMKFEVEVPSDDLCMGQSLHTDEVGSISSQVDTEASVFDVHVIDDEIDMNRQGDMGQLNLPQTALGRSHRYGVPKESSSDIKVHCLIENLNTCPKPLGTNIHRSNSDVITVGQAVDVASNRVLRLDMRRISMPAINNERSKLENEVELLRKKLKVIQEGREKLNFSVEKKEK
ncbi:uncharacterized protein LOC122002369 [Zingiber officinale]|uniref:GTD-binding domain-containing protein n=1 Tax=Zingiber officinale TaxID=94328 RepID=A0A8J5KXX8_ZINOF|nr:uncharacterized protein LOC122002369 [Zingiber officinale]KAG6493774.1 hypothetical protein ZIOFF_048777 [Zingiber officinale]